MNGRLALLAIASATVVASTARAESYSGALGLGYSNVTSRATGADASNRNVLLLDASAGLAGAPLADGWLNYQLGGTYSNVTSREPDNKLSTNNFTYSGSLSGLQPTAVPVSLFASRQISNSSTDAVSQQFLGRAVTNSYGASAGLSIPASPQASLDLVSTDTTVTNGLGEQIDHRLMMGTLRVGQSFERLRYELLGRAQRSSGSLTGAGYSSTYLNLSEESRVTDTTRFAANAALFRRSADLLGADNPDFWNEIASVQATTQHSRHLGSQFAYAYSHFRRLGGENDLDSGSHAAAANLVYGNPESWNAMTGITLTRQSSTALGVTSSGWSESLTSTLGLRHLFEAWAGQADVGASVGLTQADVGTDGGSYGVTAGLGASTTGMYETSFSAGVSGGASRDTSSIGATSYQGTANATLTTRIVGNSLARLILLGSRNVRDSKVTGRATSTVGSVQAEAQVQPAFMFALRYQHQVGASVYLQNPLEQLPVQESQNVLTDTVSVITSWQPLTDLRLEASYAFSRISANGRDQQRQTVDARLSYRIGLLTASLQDQLAFDAVSGQSRTSNVVLALLSRSFGGVF